ncbi:MAG TPA: pyridoxamine 5'-phosphate oxidase family protein [Actinomycetota bacterium]|nr:pyridoxamine 5'-phosphate oxidase family protein [Actinomycetota bacterium]
MEPIAELLGFPEEYGKAATKLDWAAVRAELERAERYWIATTREDGRPHVVPVDGIWVDDLWYYGGSEEAVHHRMVTANPQVVMHLEDAMKAVIVEGEVRSTNPSKLVAERLAATSKKKYGYAPPAADYEKGVLTLFPKRVLAWTTFPKDATRFRFDSYSSD